MAIDRKEYPFKAVCTDCGEQITAGAEAVEVNSGIIEDATFVKEDYPALYHAECFDKHFPR